MGRPGRSKTRDKPRASDEKIKRPGSARPLPKGKVMARCDICRGEGKADGKGTPVTIKHARNCPEHHLNL